MVLIPQIRCLQANITNINASMTFTGFKFQTVTKIPSGGASMERAVVEPLTHTCQYDRKVRESRKVREKHGRLRGK
jgi:hypothetical protein